MKKFDWDYAKSTHRKEVYDFLKNNHDKTLSEQEVVEMWSKLPRIGVGFRNRSPSSVKYQYKNLKEKFGFFQ